MTSTLLLFARSFATATQMPRFGQGSSLTATTLSFGVASGLSFGLAVPCRNDGYAPSSVNSCSALSQNSSSRPAGLPLSIQICLARRRMRFCVGLKSVSARLRNFPARSRIFRAVTGSPISRANRSYLLAFATARIAIWRTSGGSSTRDRYTGLIKFRIAASSKVQF